jgi:DNA-binding transcriptional MerR regulator
MAVRVPTYDAHQAERLVEVPAVQFHYFIRTGLITPRVPASRRGISRRYDARNPLELSIAGELLNAGVSAVDIGRALRCVDENWDTIAHRETRNDAGILALLRHRRSTKPPIPQLVPMKDLGPLVNTGQTIVAAIPLAHLARTIEDATGELLARR